METSEQTQKQTQKLAELLSKVQTEAKQDEFIYGVTDRAHRTFIDKANDFLIDRSNVPLKERGYFFELLATMIRAGISLVQSVKILRTKTQNRRLKRVIATVAYELEHGKQFSQTLERFPDVFGDSERGIIRSAEATGNLESALFKISGNIERQDGLRSRLVGAMIYPIAVLIALVASIGVIMGLVVPRMQQLFAENSVAQPTLTKIFIGASVWFTQYWWLLFILFIFAVIGFHVYTHSDEGRFSWDFHKLRIPIVGKLLRSVYVLRFVDSLGLLVESGLPINKALEYVANTVGNEVYRHKTYEALASVQSGEPLSLTLLRAPFLFPETVSNMMAVAEQSATIGEISVKIGQHYQREIDNTLKQLTTVLGPLMILVIGLAVAFFAIAILSPIFSLAQTVQ